MFKSICKRAIGRVSRQAVVSGAEVLRRGLVVLMLLVTASVMLNLAAPGEANAAPTQAPTVTASLSDSTILPGGTTTLTLVITNTASYAHGVMAIGEPGFLRYDFPAGVVVGAGLVTSNTCGIDIRSSAITDGQFDVLAEGAPGISGLRNPGLSAGQSCTFSVVLTAASPGVFSFDDLPIGVQSSGFTSGTGYGHIGALTVTAPPADPTPVLTFDHEVTSALVGQDFALPATSTVTAPGAGAITYSSSDTNVAVVAPETGYVTAVAIGEVTITALQAAAAGVNAEATATMTFTVEPRTPTVTSLSVTSGPQTGGTTVVLTGTNLDIISDIYFGSNATSVITVNSDTEVVVVSPAGAEGAVNVTVVTPFGTSAPDAGNLFTYDPLPPPPPAPTIASLSESSGPTEGGTVVGITGSGFSAGITAVKFGDTPVDTLFVHSDSLIYVISPPHVAGVVDVIVSTSTGDSSPSPDTQFTFIATEDPTPVLTFATPASASVVYGDSLTNAATSDILAPGAGDISYSSSDEGVATVDASSGAITTVSVGTATITATQAAAEGVNAEAAQTYLLTVTAGAGSTSDATLSASTAQLGDTVDLTITVTNTSGVDVVAGDNASVAASLITGAINYNTTTGPLSNSCGGSWSQNHIYGQTQSGIAVANGASCTIVYRLTGTGVLSDTITVGLAKGTSNLNNANYSLPLTITAATPTPVLTFATPTSASLVYGGALTNAATSTVSGGGAGAITYSSSDEGVATVDATTGALTTVSVGATTITATQAAAASVNLEATQTYALTVTAPAAPTITVTTTTFPSTIAVGGTTQLTFTLTNPNTAPLTGVAVSLTLPSGLVISQNSGGQFVNNCTNGSLSGVTGGTSISLSGARINASTSCTFTVVVRGASASSPVVATGTPSATGASAGVAGTSLPMIVNAALATIQAAPSTDLTQNVAITPFTPVVASGGVAPLSYGLSGGSLPSGLSFSNATGQITGTPAGLQSPTSYTVTVNDASIPSALTSSKTFSLSVSAAPDPDPVLTFATPTSASMVYGGALTNAATSTVSGGGAGAITYSSSDTALATVDANTGAITTTGVGTVTITATQAAAAGANTSGTATYALAITAPSAPVITTSALASWTVLQPSYSDTIVATGAAPLTFAVAGGQFPSGLTLDPNTGVITGTPNSGGGYSFTVTVTDGVGQTHTAPLSIVIVPTLNILPASLPAGAVGDLYIRNISAGGGLPPTGLVLTGDLPAGVTFNAGNGNLFGVPTEAGTFPLSFTATDSLGTTATISYSLVINVAVPVLTFTNPATSLHIGMSNSGNGATSTVTVPGAGAITYASSNPAVASVHPTSGVPLGVSAGTVTITATQAAAPGVNAEATASYDLEVKGSPTVTSFTPTSAAPAGGDSVILLGAYFTNITQLYLIDQVGGYHPLSFNLVSDGELNFLMPAVPAGYASIRLEHGGGTVVAGLMLIQEPVPAPVVTALSPNSGPGAGGALVTITGSGFEADNSVVVMFSGVWSSNVSVLSDTTIQATTPGGTGVVDVTVTHVGGTSAITPAGQYSYLPAPTLTSLDKTFGAVLGGSIIQIQGTGFTAASTVTFGGAAAVVTFIDAGRLSVVSPSHGIGEVDVVVSDNGQDSNALPFFFGPPPPVSITDSAGTLSATVSTSASVMVMLSSPYQDPVEVTVRTVDGTAEAGRDYVSRQATLTFQPGESAKSFDVEILPSTGYYPFRYLTLEIVAATGATVSDGTAFLRIDNNNPSPAPVVTGIAPTSGLTSGGTVVTVTGANFTSATAVMFGLVAAPEFQVVSATEIQTVSPAGAEGVIDVTVATPEGTSAVSEVDQFTYLPVPDPTPELTFATPDSASVVLGSTLTNAATSDITSEGAGAITYASDDTDIATVDETTGLVTPVSLGTVTITANQAAAEGVNTEGSASYELTVSAPEPPVIEGRSLPAWTVDKAGYSETIVATGGLAPLTYVVDGGSFPAGLTLDPATGVISGTPTTSDWFGFSIAVTDSLGRTAMDKFSITISGAISVEPETIDGGLVGASYSQTFTASGGTDALELSLTGDLPDGLTFDAAGGVLEGVPTEAGTFPLTLIATDSVGATAAISYSLVVNPPADPTPELTFGTPDLASVSLGSTLTNIATSTIDGEGAGAITYASDDTDIATVDETTGLVTPVSLGTVTITANQAAAEGVNTEGAAFYELTITAPAPPEIEGRSLPAWTVGDLEYRETIVATGGLAPLVFAVDGGHLPPGLTLDPATGVISGVPTEADRFGFSVQVTDALGRTAHNKFSLTINPPITVTPATLENGVVGQPFSLTFVASGGTGHLTLHRKGALPDGLVLNQETGVLSGIPTTAGTFEFIVFAEDETEVGGGNEYTLVIEAGGPSAGPVTLSVAYGSTDNPVTLALDGPSADSVAVGTPPTRGVVTVDGLAMRYTPTAGYYGADSFTYTASNANGTSDLATVTVTVERPAAPVAHAAQGETDFGGIIEIDLADSVEGVFTSVAVSTPLTGRSTLTLSGTIATFRPTDGFFGEEAFSFVATGPGGTSAPATVSLRVRDPVIVITPDSLPSATLGEVYGVTLVASGAAEPYRFALASGSLPAGLTLSATGVLSGTPTASGTFAFTVQVTSSVRGRHLPAVEKTFSLTVNGPAAPVAEALAISVSVVSETDGGATPIDLSDSVTNATSIIIVTLPQHGALTIRGFVVTYTPDAGYFGPDSFTYRAVGLPGSGSSGSQASVALSGTGAKGATPDAGVSAVATVSITVLSPTLTMTPATLSAATIGAPFSQSFTAAGGTAPYSDYRVSAGALPTGLTLSPTGLLSGTPTASGTFDFTIAATDSSTGSGPFTASRAYSLTVGAPTVSFSPGSLSDGVQGAAYGPVTFTGSGGSAPYSFSLTAGSLPTGMMLSSDGQLSGIPTQSGTFALTVRATDASTGSGPFSAERALVLTIALPVAPTAATASLAAPFNSAGVEIDVAPLVSGDYSSVALAAGPAHGSVAVSGTRFTYSPMPGYYGPDSFSYTAAGLGGTSAPATVSVTVATPAPVSSPKSATTTANAPVAIAVTAGDSGPIASIAVTQPSHGLAVVDGLSVTYTPATDYFGPDSFSYTATGAGGTSAPAVVSLTVSPLPVPTSPARTASVVAGQSVILEATTGATGGPFTAVALVSPPADGTATVSGQQITYAAPAGFSGTTSFTYSLSNPFGTSAPITATITVNPTPTTGAPITVVVPADGSGSAVLTTGATGGPFTAAAIVSLSPAGSGTLAIHQGSGPSGPTFTLTFTAAAHFSGTATASYTLTNAFATSAPGTVLFQVQPRLDPTLDPDVNSLITAQVDTTIRFATAQMSNFNARLESLRNGPGQSDLTGASLNFGDLFYRGDESDPFALRDRQLGRQDADVAPWGVRPATPAQAAGGFRAAGDGGAGGGGAASGVSLWTGGTIDLGLRRSKAGLSKLDFTTQGVSLGADVSLGDTVVIGGGTGYSSDSTEIGTSGSRSKATSTVGVVYGAWRPAENTYLELVLGWGEMSFDSRRIVALTGLPAFGERDGSQLFAAMTAAFEQRDGALTWTPYGRLALVSGKLDAFTEVSAGLGALTFHEQDIRSLKGVAGLTADYATRTRYGLLTPALRLEYAYEFEDAGAYSLGYADWVGGPVYSGSTDALGRGRLTIGVGAHLERGALLLGLEYRGAIGSDEATSNQLSATVRVKF